MKINHILAIASIISLSAVGSVFAAVDKSFTDAGTDTIGSPACSIKPSKNVIVKYTRGAANTAGTGYLTNALSAGHGSGTKTYSTTSGDTAIYMKDAVQADPVAAPAAGASGDFAGWTAL